MKAQTLIKLNTNSTVGLTLRTVFSSSVRTSMMLLNGMNFKRLKPSEFGQMSFLHLVIKRVGYSGNPLI